MSLLKARDLTVSFRSRPVDVVHRLDLNIERGSIFGLAGESGCGKSLTALAILGLLPEIFTASGSVQLEGRELIGLKREELRKVRGREISMIFQEPMTSLNPVLRVGRQIGEVLTTHLDISRSEVDRRVIELLRSVRMPSPEQRAREYPHQMSGGMRQRVMIAMAMALGPKLLIADEPTTALDVTIQAQILELMRSLVSERGTSVLLITHDLGVMAENADYLTIMYAGRVVEEAPVGVLFERPRHPYTIGLIESLPSEKGLPLKPVAGTVPRPGELPAGCRFSDRCPMVIEDCRREEPELIDWSAEDIKDKEDVAGGFGHRVRCIRAGETVWTGYSKSAA